MSHLQEMIHDASVLIGKLEELELSEREIIVVHRQITNAIEAACSELNDEGLAETLMCIDEKYFDGTVLVV